MENADLLKVEVAYALPDEQHIFGLEVPAGTTAEEAIRRSGVLERFPEIDLGRQKIGVFGKLNKPDYVLRAGDRVEIYRPLIADPKEVRKRRAEEGKRMKKGGGDLAEDS